MDILPKDLSMLSFRRTSLEHQEKISLDGKMLRLLLVLDGEKHARQVAAECGLDEPALRDCLSRLIEYGLVEPVEEVVNYLDARFFQGLKVNLAQFLGPMAEFLIEDLVAGMELDTIEVPVQRAAELISALAVELPDETSRMRFKKAMINLIPK